MATEIPDISLEKLNLSFKDFSSPTLNANLGNIGVGKFDVKIDESKIVNKDYGLELKEHETKETTFNIFSEDFYKKENFSNMWSNVKDFYSVNWNNANAKVADFYISSAKEIGATWSWENFGSKFTDDTSSLKWENFKDANNGDSLKKTIGETFSDPEIGDDGKLHITKTTWDTITLSDDWALKALDDKFGTNMLAGFKYGLAVANFTMDAVDQMMGSISDMMKQSAAIAGNWVTEVTGANFAGKWVTDSMKSTHFGDADWYALHYLVDGWIDDAKDVKLPTYYTPKKVHRTDYPIRALIDLNTYFPDEFSNMFDVYFVLNKKTENLPDNPNEGKNDSKPLSSEDETDNSEKDFQRILSSRIESITIPGRSVGTFEQKAMGSGIVKSTTKLEMKSLSSFTLQADNSLYWVHLFNKAGQVDFSNMESWKDSIRETKLGSNGELPFMPYMSDYSLDIYVVAYDFDFKAAPKILELKENSYWDVENTRASLADSRRERIKQKREEAKKFLDWVLAGHNVRKEDKKIWQAKFDALKKEAQETAEIATVQMQEAQQNQSFEIIPGRTKWVFEDCRFLGSGNPISFKKDSADPMKFTYEFTFRKLSRR